MKMNGIERIFFIMIGIIIISSCYFLNMNLSIGLAFISKGVMLIFFVYSMLVIVISLKEKLKIPIIMVIIVIAYLMFSVVPTLSLCVDLIEYSDSSYSEFVGVVNDKSVSGLVTNVVVDEQEFMFYGPFNSIELEIGKSAQINFLPRSKIAVSYEQVN